MYQKPRTAKKLYFDIIPKTVDEYLAHLESYTTQDALQRLNNPVWHIHASSPPEPQILLTYSLLLNLVTVCHSDDKRMLWHFISRYNADARPETAPILDRLLDYAIRYYRDFVKPTQRHRAPSEDEKRALADLAAALRQVPEGASAEEIQTVVYEIGKQHPTFANLRSWFQALYQILLGQNDGPRMGSFIALYGIPETIALIDTAIAGAANDHAVNPVEAAPGVQP